MTLPPSASLRRLWRLAGPLLALAVVALVARQVVHDWRRLPAGSLAAFRLTPGLLVAAWSVQTVGWVVAVDAWRRILAALGVRAALVEHARLYTYTALTQVLPGSFWVPASRVVGYRQVGASAWAVSAALVIEWLLVGIAGALWFAASAPIGARAVGPRWLPWLAVVLLVATLASPGTLARFGEAVLAARGRRTSLPVPRRRDAAWWLMEELAVVGASGVTLYLFMGGLTDRSDLAVATSTMGITVAVGAWLAWMPLTSVLRAGMMVVLLAPVYHSSVIALAVAIAWRIWCLLTVVSSAVLAALGARWCAPRREVAADRGETD